jgi:peptidyl-prolyl cis-trans isomerase D
MLHVMRKHAKYFYVLFFLIIITFVFWGTGTNDTGQQSRTLATVGDETITYEEFQRGLDRAQDLYSSVYKDEYDDDMRDRLKRDVLSALLQSKILAIAARDSGITVSDDEVNEVITTDPVFMRDGRFSTDVYLNTLRLNRISPVAYEASQRNELLIKKMYHIFESAVAVTPAETLSIQGDPELKATIEKSMLEEKRSAVIASFINAYRMGLNITVEEDLLL